MFYLINKANINVLASKCGTSLTHNTKDVINCQIMPYDDSIFMSTNPCFFLFFATYK